MNSIQIGAAVVPPVASLPMVLKSSRPTHTPHTRSRVYAMNQLSLKSFDVPVLPPAGRPSSLAFWPVPFSTTFFIRSTITYAVSAGMRRRGGSGLYSSTMLPSASTILVKSTGFTSMPHRREGRVAVGVLDQRHLRRAERDRRMAHDLRRDAELADLLDHLVDAHRRDEPHADGVERVLQRGPQRDRAEELRLVVVRRPQAGRGLDRHRRVLHDAHLGEAVLERRRVDVRLDRRARLALAPASRD